MDKIEINEKIELKTLVSFSCSYTNSLLKLKNYLNESNGKLAKIILARIINEQPVYKIIIGTIKEINENNFCIVSDHDFFSEYDFEKETVVHFDNLLGDIPMLFSNKIKSPVSVKTGNLKSYLNVLLKMKKMMRECEDKIHSALLTFTHNGYKKTIECEIVKVNRSNVEYNHLRTIQQSQIDLVPGVRNEKFFTPTQYLSGVQVSHGIKNKINPYDEE